VPLALGGRDEQFERIARRIERQVLCHRIITDNRYTAWFARGEQTREQVRAFISRSLPGMTAWKPNTPRTRRTNSDSFMLAGRSMKTHSFVMATRCWMALRCSGMDSTPSGFRSRPEARAHWALLDLTGLL
jgi:hypothetical protein